MNNREQNGDSFDEAQIDSLLKEFFRREVPFAESENAAPRLLDAARVKRGRRERAAGLFGLSAAAGSLLAVVALLSPPRDDSVRQVAGADSGNKVEEAVAAGEENRQPAFARAAQKVRIAVTAAEDAVEQIDPVNGPVEQRSKLRIRNVEFLDRDTGDKVELSLPELEIEIFPLDDGPEIELDGEALLRSEPFRKELKQLPPEVRRNVEATLRGSRNGRPKVQVRKPP